MSKPQSTGPMAPILSVSITGCFTELGDILLQQAFT